MDKFEQVSSDDHQMSGSRVRVSRSDSSGGRVVPCRGGGVSRSHVQGVGGVGTLACDPSNDLDILPPPTPPRTDTRL